MNKLNLPKPNIFDQLKIKPKIENSKNLKKKPLVIVGAVGGSQLPIEIVREYIFEPAIIMHRNYGLPKLNKGLNGKYQAIAISYSGNSEETIDFTLSCLNEKIPVSVICKGGRLLEIAKENNLPYIVIPESDLQPRDAIGFIIRAFFALLKAEDYVKLNDLLTVDQAHENYALFQAEEKSKEIAYYLKDSLPIIYSASPLESLSLIWKIRFNENVKIHAFRNIFPELNHNEMAGFGPKNHQKRLYRKSVFIFINHHSYDARNQNRLKLTEKLASKFGAKTIVIDLPSELDSFSALIYGIYLADCVSYELARKYKIDPAPVDSIEEFKLMMKK